LEILLPFILATGSIHTHMSQAYVLLTSGDIRVKEQDGFVAGES
jgi:hypothetical protein